MTGLGAVTAALTAPVLLMSAIHPVSAQPRPDRSAPAASPSRSHEQHGTPKGWKLTWPKGDPAKGRAVFAKLECYSCHEVRGEKFPAPKEKEKVGPELSMMVDREGRVHCSVRRLRQPGRWRHVQLRCARTRPPGKSRNRWGTGAAPRLVVVAAGGL
jgi:hypothetical protein